MTELEKAISEIKRSRVDDTYTLETAEAWRVISKAVASGELIPATERADAVKIKPLVWRFFDVDHSFGKGVYDANSIGHTYTIQDCGKRDFPMRFYVSAVSASFAELSDAKAAAQADYEARIRAAIGGVE